ncbi:ABC transporter permease subunit [Nocardioides sp. R-C-SC26]|uniref:ABC transporter permease subunit n=1 Tax=Nocardioides sp. R-C-SC26 TaxID=2870414 RepID=UPI001E2AC1B6|nr:ABC transporter permease subunit [Nocardioides sp. R-C-SC26]
MSTPATATAVNTRTIDISATPAVPMSRLISVEIRKSFDTRAGRWLTFSILGITVIATALGALFFEESAQDYVSMLSMAGGIMTSFLPILMILLITSEWSQRTGLATFTLEPRRSRVVVAKFLAGIVLSIAVLLLGASIAAVGTLASPVNGGSADWNLTWDPIPSFFLGTLIAVFVGFAFAMLLRNSPAAIVGYFVYSLIVPTVAGILAYIIKGLEDVIPWIEFNTAQAPLYTGDFTLSGQEWAQLLVSGTIWLVLPFFVGLRLLLRAEVK